MTPIFTHCDGPATLYLAEDPDRAEAEAAMDKALAQYPQDAIRERGTFRGDGVWAVEAVVIQEVVE